MKIEELLAQLENKLEKAKTGPIVINQGTIISVGDGIVVASGLSQAGFGEEVEFEDSSRGLVLSLDEERVSIVLLSTTNEIVEGMKVKTTGNILSAHVSKDLLGRVLDPIGNPLDGKGLRISKGEYYPFEKLAPGVIERQPVDTPLKTGIKAIDGMIPIGRGQRQLIIGDRSTGKTAIALDTIINQKKKDLGLKQVICVYCVIGQKRGSVAQTIARLQEEGALDYTVIVAATSSDPAALQYLAPFAATAIAEYFMDQGNDVVVIYDDFSKHAQAYRQLSLLLRRPAGREAYPGDIFFLHSRILERAARLSKKKGGGSITALPIIETQANDVSAYIPTNVISITDGQIYLEPDLFNTGMRPAINAGISVSRVGGAAQTKAMKQVAGALRLDLAQFRELAAFAQFGSDLDAATAQRIERGKRVTEVLKQKQYNPYGEVEEIAIIYAATQGLLDNLPLERVQEFEEKFLTYIQQKHKKLVAKINSGDKMSNETLEELTKAINDYKKTFTI